MSHFIYTFLFIACLFYDYPPPPQPPLCYSITILFHCVSFICIYLYYYTFIALPLSFYVYFSCLLLYQVLFVVNFIIYINSSPFCSNKSSNSFYMYTKKRIYNWRHLTKDFLITTITQNRDNTDQKSLYLVDVCLPEFIFINITAGNYMCKQSFFFF